MSTFQFIAAKFAMLSDIEGEPVLDGCAVKGDLRGRQSLSKSLHSSQTASIHQILLRSVHKGSIWAKQIDEEEKNVEICELQEAIGDVFNPFVLISLGWSVFTLCLTIYFVTQADDSMNDPPRCSFFRQSFLCVQDD